MNKIVEIYCDVDDFCRIFVPEWEKRCLTDGSRKRRRQGRMTSSEVITLIICISTDVLVPTGSDKSHEKLSVTRFDKGVETLNQNKKGNSQ